MDRLIVIEESNLHRLIADCTRTALKALQELKEEQADTDAYMTSKQLEEVIPSMKASTIKAQIRAGKYGKRQGGKGILVARPSEVRRHNRIQH